MVRPGPLNLITDVAGVTVGHATDAAAETGVTVVLCPGGWTAAADIRGGAPGERDLAVLDLENLMVRAHAVVLSGGSVYGLAAADGVTLALAQASEGVRLAPGHPLVPLTPSAILYDLDRGDKDWGLDPPYRRLGMEAVAAAGTRFGLGRFGAGRGAKAGLAPGGVGSCSLRLRDGLTVGALVAANPLGSIFMADGATPWAWPHEIDGEFGGRRPEGIALDAEPLPDLGRLSGRAAPGANTTLGVIAVSADLTAAECKRVAIMAHDGMARAIRPSHTPFDGDIVFVVANGQALGAVDRHAETARIGSAAADCLARAIARGVVEAGRQAS